MIYTDIAVDIRKHIRTVGVGNYLYLVCSLQNASRNVHYFNYEASPFVFTPHQYYSGDPTSKNEMGAACSTCGERRGAYRILVGNPE